MSTISLDTETCGVDLYHGAKPFLVTICNEEGDNTFWEWAVDPLTRQPLVPPADLVEIQDALDAADVIVLQNAKFDVAALKTIMPNLRWDWSKVRDTLLAGHLLATNHPHDLTSMALEYLNVDIEPVELRMKEVVQDCRKQVQQARLRAKKGADEPLAAWAIAEKDRPDMPSASDKVWKYDCWLPRTMITKGGMKDKMFEWMEVTSEYANTDSAITLKLWQVQEELLAQRKLEKIYAERLRVLPVAHKMEQEGVTINRRKLNELGVRYLKTSQANAEVCVGIAKEMGYDLELPKSGNNNSLKFFCFGKPADKLEEGEEPPPSLKLPVIHRTEKGEPSLDTKHAIPKLLDTLDPTSREGRFIRALAAKRKKDTSLSYMEGYERYWRPMSKLYADWFRLHPNLNPTGTYTLRWSSNHPNEQNISKLKDEDGLTLRYCFGPAPGREWWSLDAKNLELRIPAYESGERMMVDLFEREDEPPFYGSYHLLIFSILHPQMWAENGMKCKDVYASTWYQWTKNGNFAVTYGAVEESGTADRAYHVPGAQRRIKDKLKDLDALNRHYIQYAEKHGYVETIPDRSVDPTRGYPVLCSRSDYGRILPTVPLNYHVQSTAMWWMARAMVRVQDKLDQWNEQGFSGRIALQVHDQLMLDFPKKGDPTKDDKGGYKSNLWRVRIIQKLMEQGGEDIGVKTPVSVEFHPETWAEGIAL